MIAALVSLPDPITVWERGARRFSSFLVMAADVPLAFYQPAGLFLKAEAKIFIEVKLPEIKVSGISVSNWEVMEKIKALSKPEEFQSLRVANYSRERIQFEGEFESLRAMRKVILLLNGKSMKLSGFAELLKIRATQDEPPYPTKNEWEDFFVEKGLETFDEGRPGERPDTVRIRGLPMKWFTSKSSDGEPCPRVLTQAFQRFGKVRQVGIYDPSSHGHRRSGSFLEFGPGSGARFLHFEAYVQYEKYVGFCNAISSLKGMQLLRLEEGGKEVIARMTVDFDKTGFLSERNVRKRRHAEERRKREMEEVEKKKEEEKKAQVMKNQEAARAKDEQKAQKKAKKQGERQKRKEQQAILAARLKSIAIRRREEAQRLLGVLLAGAAEARYQEEEQERQELLKKQQREEEEERRKEKLESEALLRDNLIKNVQQLEQRKLDIQRELLLRSLPSGSGSQLKSAVVIPKEDLR